MVRVIAFGIAAALLGFILWAGSDIFFGINFH